MALVVDALCKEDIGAHGIPEGGVGAAAVEEAVEAIAEAATDSEIIPDDLALVVDAPGLGAVVVDLIPDDLARGVDACCNGAAGGQGIVESGVGATAV